MSIQRIEAAADTVKLGVKMCGLNQQLVGCSEGGLSLGVSAAQVIGIGTSTVSDLNPMLGASHRMPPIPRATPNISYIYL